MNILSGCNKIDYLIVLVTIVSKLQRILHHFCSGKNTLNFLLLLTVKLDTVGTGVLAWIMLAASQTAFVFFL